MGPLGPSLLVNSSREPLGGGPATRALFLEAASLSLTLNLTADPPIVISGPGPVRTLRKSLAGERPYSSMHGMVFEIRGTTASREQQGTNVRPAQPSPRHPQASKSWKHPGIGLLSLRFRAPVPEMQRPGGARPMIPCRAPCRVEKGKTRKGGSRGHVAPQLSVGRSSFPVTPAGPSSNLNSGPRFHPQLPAGSAVHQGSALRLRPPRSPNSVSVMMGLSLTTTGRGFGDRLLRPRQLSLWFDRSRRSALKNEGLSPHCGAKYVDQKDVYRLVRQRHHGFWVELRLGLESFAKYP